MNTKKYSILNLVNCILLALTLTFSVISYAWYSPAEELATPISFGAGDTGTAIKITKIKISDATSEHPPLATATDAGEYLGDEEFNVGSLNFGTIDDLGVLKDSNVVYYCLTIPVTSGTDSFINLSYDKSLMQPVALAADNTKAELHFNLYSLDANGTNPTLLTTDGNETNPIYYHAEAQTENFVETTEKPIKTFLAYSCVATTTPPLEVGATDNDDGDFATTLKGLFTNAEEYPISSTKYDPTNSTTEIRSVDAPDNLEANATEYYVYLKIYTDLDNYHEIAQLLMDNMPFCVAFGVKLYIDTKPTYESETTETTEATEAAGS